MVLALCSDERRVECHPHRGANDGHAHDQLRPNYELDSDHFSTCLDSRYVPLPALHPTELMLTLCPNVDLTSTILTTVTNAQGSASVSTALILPTLAANNTDTSGSTGKTWGIVGGVVGVRPSHRSAPIGSESDAPSNLQGIAVLAAGLFVFWRFTQRRFSDLDDARHDDIKWPELQPDGAVPASSSTLNPLGTRRTGRSGVEMGDEWDDGMGREGNYYDEGGYAPSTAGAYCSSLSLSSPLSH